MYQQNPPNSPVYERNQVSQPTCNTPCHTFINSSHLPSPAEITPSDAGRGFFPVVKTSGTISQEVKPEPEPDMVLSERNHDEYENIPDQDLPEGATPLTPAPVLC